MQEPPDSDSPIFLGMVVRGPRDVKPCTKFSCFRRFGPLKWLSPVLHAKIMGGSAQGPKATAWQLHSVSVSPISTPQEALGVRQRRRAHAMQANPSWAVWSLLFSLPRSHLSAEKHVRRRS